MPNFAQLRQGTRARTTVQLTLTTGEEVPVDLRVLTPLEVVGVLAAATRYATERGCPAEDGAAVYDLALQVHTLVACAVDHDSPVDAPAPFFASVDQVLSSSLLPPDGIAHLFALYEHHADDMALGKAELNEAGMRKLIESCAEGDLVPFSKLRPGMQWSFVRFLAAAQLTALKAKSPSSSGSVSGTSKPNGTLDADNTGGP